MSAPTSLDHGPVDPRGLVAHLLTQRLCGVVRALRGRGEEREATPVAVLRTLESGT